MLVEEMADFGYTLFEPVISPYRRFFLKFFTKRFLNRRLSSRPCIEDLIIKIVRDNPGARFLEGIPVILSKTSVDYDKLFELAKNYNLQNKIGFILEVSYKLFKEFNPHLDYSKLEKTIHRLKKIKMDNEETLSFENSQVYRNFAKKMRSNLLKEWNLIDLYKEEDFKKNFELYR